MEKCFLLDFLKDFFPQTPEKGFGIISLGIKAFVF